MSNAFNEELEAHLAPLWGRIQAVDGGRITDATGEQYFTLTAVLHGLFDSVALCEAAQSDTDHWLQAIMSSLPLTWSQHGALLSCQAILQTLAWKSAVPEAVAYQHWYCQVLHALYRWGCYAPERQHQPLPGEEMAAIETREMVREHLDRRFPGFGVYAREMDALLEQYDRLLEESDPARLFASWCDGETTPTPLTT